MLFSRQCAGGLRCSAEPLGKWVQSLLFGLSPHDPIMLGLSGALLVAVALFAGYLATYRAARLNPVDALRQG
jgi:ABC-type antimicrobial peptide transport system permease subunit